MFVFKYGSKYKHTYTNISHISIYVCICTFNINTYRVVCDHVSNYIYICINTHTCIELLSMLFFNLACCSDGSGPLAFTIHNRYAQLYALRAKPLQ